MRNNSEKERILFVGGKERGLELVKYFLETRRNLVGIFCQKEEEHELAKYSPQIKKLAEENKIPFFPARSVNKGAHRERISEFRPDLIVVMGWPTLISQQILDIPRLGCVAVHESKLPAYRGFAPVSWQIINGEREIGLSLFYLDSGMDSGDIIAQENLPIRDDEYIEEIYPKAGRIGVEMIKKHLDQMLTGTAPRRRQDETKSSYCCPRIPADGEIDWALGTRKVYNLIRGISRPYPGAFTYTDGKKLLVWEASVPAQRHYIGRIPGRVVKVHLGVGVEVLTGDGQLIITKVQLEGGDEATADQFVRSIKQSLG